MFNQAFYCCYQLALCFVVLDALLNGTDVSRKLIKLEYSVGINSKRSHVLRLEVLKRSLAGSNVVSVFISFGLYLCEHLCAFFFLKGQLVQRGQIGGLS
ncbi:hypothetical protein D9M72_653980 [compost metagenome]